MKNEKKREKLQIDSFQSPEHRLLLFICENEIEIIVFDMPIK